MASTDLPLDSSAQPVVVVGASTAGVTSTPMAVGTDGSAQVKDIADGTAGGTPPTIAIQVAGSDGTALRVIKTAADGTVKVDGSAVTQPVSLAGTVATQDLADGPVAPGVAATKSELQGGVFNSVLPTLANTQQAAIQLDSSGRQIISPLTNSSAVKSQIQDNAGAGITSTLIASKQRLDVDTAFSGPDNTTAPSYTGQIGGSDSTGKLQAAKAATTGELFVTDSIDVAAQYAAQSVTTAAAEAKAGATRLLHRKFIAITPTNGTVYWGTSSTVTVSTGTPIFKNQCMTMAFTDNVPIYLIAASTVDCRVVEGS